MVGNIRRALITRIFQIRALLPKLITHKIVKMRLLGVEPRRDPEPKSGGFASFPIGAISSSYA